MKVRFSREALADFDEIFTYINERNPAAASKLAGRIEHLTGLIGRYPLMGKQTKRAEFRQVALGNYLIVYKVLGDEVLIRYVRHAARQRPWEDEFGN